MILFLKNTKKLSLLLSLIFLQQFNSKAQTSTKIETLISKMTLAEKVGQMTNITIGMVASEIGDSIVINKEKLRNVMLAHHVGSFQNVIGHAYSLKNWH